MVVHAFSPRTWEAEEGGFLSLRPAWSTKWVPGQPGLYRETLSCCAHLGQQGKRNTVGFFSTAFIAGTPWCCYGDPGNPGRTAYIHPSTGEGYVSSWDWLACWHFISMHPLGRVWRQVVTSAGAIRLFMATVYLKTAISFRRWLPTHFLRKFSILEPYINFKHYTLSLTFRVFPT